MLHSSIRAPTYAILSDLLVPAKPGEKPLDDISTVLWNHFKPKRSVTEEHFHFHKQDQAASEIICNFVVALTKPAIHCQFGDTLQEKLHDCFVCILSYEAIQRCLLSESDLTYKKALEISRWKKAANKDTKLFKMTNAMIKSYAAILRALLVATVIAVDVWTTPHTATSKIKDTKWLTCEKLVLRILVQNGKNSWSLQGRILRERSLEWLIGSLYSTRHWSCSCEIFTLVS